MKIENSWIGHSYKYSKMGNIKGLILYEVPYYVFVPTRYCGYSLLL